MKIVGIIILSICIAQQGITQISQELGFRYGLGYNFASGDESELTKNKLSYSNLGVFMNFRVNRLISLQPELQVYETGYKADVTDPVFGQSIKTDISLKYLGINFISKIHYDLNFLNISLFIGPSFNFLTSATLSYSFYKDNIASVINYDYITGIIGLTIDRSISRSDFLFFEARLNYNFTTIDDSYINKSLNNSSYLHQLSLNIGYKHMLGSK